MEYESHSRDIGFSEKQAKNKPIGSKEWANSQLRFSIRILKGEIMRSSWKGRLQLVLYIKKRLLEHGFTWQAKRIDNWIHRLQPRKADLSEREGGASF
jgi:hypothetical protein